MEWRKGDRRFGAPIDARPCPTLHGWKPRWREQGAECLSLRAGGPKGRGAAQPFLGHTVRTLQHQRQCGGQTRVPCRAQLSSLGGDMAPRQHGPRVQVSHHRRKIHPNRPRATAGLSQQRPPPRNSDQHRSGSEARGATGRGAGLFGCGCIFPGIRRLCRIHVWPVGCLHGGVGWQRLPKPEHRKKPRFRLGGFVDGQGEVGSVHHRHARRLHLHQSREFDARLSLFRRDECQWGHRGRGELQQHQPRHHRQRAQIPVPEPRAFGCRVEERRLVRRGQRTIPKRPSQHRPGLADFRRIGGGGLGAPNLARQQPHIALDLGFPSGLQCG